MSQSADKETDFRYGNEWIFAAYTPGNARLNMTESELSRLPAEEVAQWRRFWATIKYQSDARPSAPFYFRREVDQYVFAEVFGCVGAIVELGEVWP